MKQFAIILLLALFLISLPFTALAADVESSVATDPVTEPDTSDTVPVTLEDVNISLGVIQSQLWIILVVGLLGYVYKFFRIFF